MALEHAWKWYEFWNHLAYQTINIYIIAAAFMTAGYASTFGAHLHVAAAATAMSGIPATWAAYVGVDRAARRADRALAPLAAIQSQLAHELDIDSLELVTLTIDGPSHWSTRGPFVGFVLVFVNLLCLVGTGVALAT